MKTAVLFITHTINDNVIAHFSKLKSEMSEYGDLYFCIQEDALNRAKSQQYGKTFLFNRVNLNKLGYNAWGCIMPGGNVHFILLDFFFQYQMYDYYWIVEYDVYFNGNWATFFSYFNNRKEDYISAHVETVEENPNWTHWKDIDLVNIHMDEQNLLKSFNPISRYSYRAICLLHERLLLGDRGHNEIILPTLFRYFNLSIFDFGGEGLFSDKCTPNLFYCDNPVSEGVDKSTHRYRPGYSKDAMCFIDKIYHPVK